MTIKFQEPAPIHNDLNPLDSMMERFSVAAEILGLDDSTYKVMVFLIFALSNYFGQNKGLWRQHLV